MVDPIVALAVFAGIVSAGDGVCGVFSGGPGLAAFRIDKEEDGESSGHAYCLL